MVRKTLVGRASGTFRYRSCTDQSEMFRSSIRTHLIHGPKASEGYVLRLASTAGTARFFKTRLRNFCTTCVPFLARKEPAGLPIDPVRFSRSVSDPPPHESVLTVAVWQRRRDPKAAVLSTATRGPLATGLGTRAMSRYTASPPFLSRARSPKILVISIPKAVLFVGLWPLTAAHALKCSCSSFDGVNVPLHATVHSSTHFSTAVGAHGSIAGARRKRADRFLNRIGLDWLSLAPPMRQMAAGDQPAA